MSINRAIAIMGASLFISACGAASEDRVSGPKAPVQGGIAEFTPLSFDGEYLKVRVLVGATTETFIMGGRLLPYADIELRNIRACDTGERLASYLFDYVLPADEKDEQVLIRPQYWYGADVEFHLFDRRRYKVSPECFQAELWVWSLDGRMVMKKPVEVKRMDKPVPAVEGR